MNLVKGFAEHHFKAVAFTAVVLLASTLASASDSSADLGAGDTDLTWQMAAGIGYGFGWKHYFNNR